MIRTWYTGASGMNAQQNRLNTISNNLANVNTAGYKRDVTCSKSFPELLLRRMNMDGVYETPFGSAEFPAVIGKVGLGVETNENYTDFTQGSFRETSANTDVALNGKGFFSIQTPQGERYTRDGNFIVGKEGILETKDGYPVLGEDGLIRVENDKFKIDVDGMIYLQDTDDFVDRLKIVRFDNERYLKKEGINLYSSNDISGDCHIAEGSERPTCLQSYMETSNVNVVNEMVQMIEVNRAYEANQKTIQSGDSMMGTLWNKTAVYK